jgi:hypothetical protein
MTPQEINTSLVIGKFKKCERSECYLMDFKDLNECLLSGSEIGVNMKI